MPPRTPPPASAPPTIVTPTYSGPERRSEFRRWREKIDLRLDDGAHAMKGLRLDLDENTRATHEMLDLLNSVKGAFRVLGWIGALAKPLGAIAMLCAACLGLWSSIKGGGVK
ncbi:MAG: hypothetical protein WBK26_16820 [Burkholderiaceae bacterium]